MPDGLQTKPRAMRLKAVAPKTAAPTKPKILIFGRAGVGKTWSALDFPGCYYIDTEGGANLPHYTEKLERSGGMYLGPEHGSNDFATVFEQVHALATEEHSFRTLVIDSVSHLFGSDVANEQERLDAKNEKDEYGASNKPAARKMRRIVNWLGKIDMNVILIAHEKDEYGNVDGKRQVIGQTFDCWAKLDYILDLVMRIDKISPTKRFARIRKTRLLGFPDGESFPWSYSDFADRYGREIIEGSVHRLNVGTPEQVAEFNDLYARVKMADDWLEKCLKADKADQVEDLRAECLAAMINQMKERLTK